MKKTLIFIGTLVLLIFGTIQAYADENSLVNMGLVPSDLQQNTTRAEMAFIISRMYTDKIIESCETEFSDVESGSKYSGYIDYAVKNNLMSADGDKFNPEGDVEVNEFLKAFYDKIGYAEFAELCGGYDKLAMKHRLLNNVSNTKKLTKENFINLLTNILKAEVYEIRTVYSGGRVNAELGSNMISLIKEGYGITKLSAEILSADDTVTFKVINKPGGVKDYIRNKTYTHVYESVNMKNYKYTSGDIYIRDDKVIYYTVDNEYQIYTTYIYAVNNDRSKTNKYLPRLISEIELYDGKKYKTDNLKVEYNFSETTSPVSLSEKCAKIVFKNKKIIFIETWDLEEGGLAVEKYEGGIRYIKGTNSSMLSPKFRNYQNVSVYIDGEIRNYSDIKKDSIFDYYIDENNQNAVIIVSEKNIYDTINGLGTDNIYIGNAVYPCDSSKLYFSKDGINYFDSSSIIYEEYAEAFADGRGNVRYIRILNNEKNDFIGMLEGYEQETFGETRIKVYIISDVPESKIFDLSEKVVVEGKIGTINDVLNTCSLSTYDAMYRFYVNSKGMIYKIEKPVSYLNYDQDIRSNGSIPYNDGSSMTIGTKKIYPANLPLIVLYRENNEYKIYQTTFKAFGNRDTTTGTFNYRFISENNPNVLKYVVLFGPAENIFLKSTNVFAVVTDKTKVYIDGSVKHKVTFLADNGVEKVFYIDESDTQLLEEYKPGHFMQFNRGYLIGPEYGNLGTYDYDLTVDFDEIEVDGTSNTGFKKGIIRSIDEEYIIFEDGSLYGDLYWRTKGTRLFARLNSGEINLISASDISSGDEVLYFLSGGSVSAVFIK